jgi:hypothetical protein
VDPGQGRAGQTKSGRKIMHYPEVPYDYGVEIKSGSDNSPWQGALPFKDQSGAKGFQDGLGVNMRGDIAVESNIYYAPKMEEAGHATAFAGPLARIQAGLASDEDRAHSSYAGFMRGIHDRQKRGEQVYFIRREPGIPLVGSTVWVYDRTGELREECAVITRWIINGLQIDEDGNLYLVNASPRIIDPEDGYFLWNKGGTFGMSGEKARQHTFTGTLMKTNGKKVRMRLARAPVPLDSPPSRKPDVMAAKYPGPCGREAWAWVDGAQWFYAGASPLKNEGCSCPVLRIHLDWYKRTFVPEAYRHSFGVVDTNGNLIMHIGKYGNFDSASGAESRVPVGGDNIAVFLSRFISGTDNYIVYEDWGERIVVLKINYHAEESAPIQGM